MSDEYSESWRPKILVTHSELHEEAKKILEEKCDVTYLEGLPEPTRKQILDKCKGMDGILWATHTNINAEALDAAGPKLKSISTISAGLEYVDIPEVKKRGIALGYTPNILNAAVADLAICLIIAAARRLHEGRHKVEIAEWHINRPFWMLGKDIKGSTVGIVGLGGIGQAIVKRLKGFDIGQVLYSGHSRKTEGDKLGAKFVSFDELLSKSDFVIVSCPLTNETRGMFNEAAFIKMKTDSVFVNISRGDIVNQTALVKALKENTIFAAGLDVTTPEPLPIDHPLIELSNCVITPHLGSATTRTRTDMSIIAAYNVVRGIFSEPLLSPVP